MNPWRDEQLRRATPGVDDVEARRARSAIEGRLFSGPTSPVTVGRYEVLGRIGAGGMGVVYRAHDPELDRDVAVKLMHSDAVGEEQAQLARARLVREARAMARLAHPNVLHVYDVGTVHDGVFIAMELVEGQSLDAWVTHAPRPWSETLRRYIDAGRGLAAAHAAGVIHRDFKPENVLVGVDGRVRVGDFGLAGGLASSYERSIDDGGSTPIDLASTDRGHQAVHESLTQTGTLLGTPKYMAPEQESGAPANARSDQFSFCVALYESLYGRPPFEGDTVLAYRMNVRAGRLCEPPTDSAIPALVYRELARGLAIDPAARHPGMDALLAQLEAVLEDPRIVARRRRRIRLVASLLAVAMVAWIVGWSVGRIDPPDPSEPTQASLEAAAASLEPTVVATAPSGSGPQPPPAATPTAVDPGISMPAVGERKPPAKPPGASAPRPNRRLGNVCYFSQDVYKFLGQQRRAARFVIGDDGQCYDCTREAGEHHRTGLTPPQGSDCRQFRICAEESSDKCG